MEFLVRLDDKVNTQVFCLNPVHKGQHMDRHFFEDSTFAASCPLCHSKQWLYRKNNAIPKKGALFVFRPDGWEWGTNERKHFGIVRIDCTSEQAVEWCAPIQDREAENNALQYEKDYAQRKDQLKTEGKTIEEIKADAELQAIEENHKLSRNTAKIALRAHKMKFDFEKVLNPEQLRNWNDMNAFSEIVQILERDKAQIKEVQWH